MIERRDTPLAEKLKARIHREGPLSIKDYVAACLGDEEFGYYRRQPAIGASADFITAPEISQVFGELIGLWCAVVWQQMGSPSHLNLFELGPGRGTLMRDALRAARIVPGFQASLTVHLVDSNAALVPLQKAALADAGVPLLWHDSADRVRAALDGPFVVIANEFLDACPGEQYVMREKRLTQRGVGLDDTGELTFTLLDAHLDTTPASPTLPDTVGLRDGDCLEIQDFAFFEPFARRMGEVPAAALFIDYGSDATGARETLQAVRAHRAEPPLASPGEADLSFQVDFAQFRARALAIQGLVVDGPVPQAEFLGRLGIVERASRLMASNAGKAGVIEGQVQRLMAPTGMGSRFLALGVRSIFLPPLPGLV